MGSALRGAWIIGGVFAGIAACESPTLPLPPPELPGISQVAGDSDPPLVKLTSQYGAAPYALVVTYNSDPRVPNDKAIGGARADANGSWDTTIEAFSEDTIEITQQIGAAESPPEIVTIP